MSLKLLILRPLDGAKQTEHRARKRGLDTVIDPLFVVEPVAWTAPEAGNFDALLLTSTNAVRCGGTGLEAYQSLPVLAVGEKTAAAAKEAGFHVEKTGSSCARELLHQLEGAPYRSILWLAGKQHTNLTAAAQQTTVVPVYQSRAIPLGQQAQASLADECIILLHSVRAAQHLVAEHDRLGLPKNRQHLLAFSAKVAKAAGQGWKSVQTADHPDDDALLALASALCQGIERIGSVERPH